MSWHFSLEPGEGFSVDTYLAGLLSARSSSKNTHAMSCCNASAMEFYRHSPSGTMFAPSTAPHGEDSLTSSAEASHAKTSQAQEKAQALRESEAASGKKCTESFATFDRVSRSWKTAQCLLLGGLEPYSETWPKAGIMLHGLCSELMTWELPTSERESGFLHLIPSPTACNAPNVGANTTGPKSLLEVAQTGWKPGQVWIGTPTASMSKRSKKFARKTLTPAEFIEKYPTPMATDAKNNGSPGQQRRHSPQLGAVVGGALNPQWVEWLMGWPIGWTDLKPLAMAKFHSWLQQHSQHFIKY